jgi:hypothetical protein
MDQGFGFSKPAHSPCRYLQCDFRCAIHDQLLDRGFPACRAFDCYGAGQRVTQHLFDGQSWRSSPEMAQRMFHAYSRYRMLHELLAMLELAIQYALPEDASLLQEYLQSLERICDSSEALSEAVSVDAIRRSVLQRIREVLGKV